MIFIDTTIWVAAIDSNDILHEDGVATLKAIIERKLPLAITTDYVLDEVMTLLKRRKIPGKKIVNIIKKIFESPRVIVVFIDEKLFSEAIKIFSKYDQLSFTDATTIAVMKTYKLKEIFSHDSDFDIPRILRRKNPHY